MWSARAEFLADTDYNSSNGKGLITVQPVDILNDLLKQLPQLSQLWVTSQLVSTLPVMLWIGDRFRRDEDKNSTQSSHDGNAQSQIVHLRDEVERLRSLRL